MNTPAVVEVHGRSGLDVLSNEWDISCADPDTFAARISSVQIGGVAIEAMDFTSARGERTAERMIADPREVVHFALVRRGSIVVRQDGRATLHTAPAFGLTRSDGPFALDFRPQPGSRFCSIVRTAVPVHLLGPKARRLRRLTARAVPESAAVASLRGLLHTLVSATPTPGTDSSAFLEHAVIDLSLAVLVELLEEPLAAASVEAGTRLRMREFVSRRLSDRNLNADVIAAQFGVSRRYVYRLFETEGTSVAAFIRALRLDLARDMLADRRGRTVAEIAAATGFGGTTQFARAFKSRHGVTPSDVRRTAATGGR